MSWVRIDEFAPFHPKVVQAGVAAFGVFCAGLCYANKFLTDGFIPVGALSAVFPGERWNVLVKLAVKLVEVGLWEKRDNGWQIHDYHHYQPTKAEVLEERRRSAERYSAGGRARASVADRIQGRFMRASDSPASRRVAGDDAGGIAGPDAGGRLASTVSVAVSVPISVTEEKPETTASKKRNNNRVVLTDDQFMAKLKLNPAFSHLNIDEQDARMDAWLLANPGRQKTRRFVVNWLNRQERPMAVNGKPDRRNVNATWAGKTEAREVKL